MMQGVLTPERVRLLLRKGSKCYRQRRTGEMKGESEIAGLTDGEKPVRRGPKRATKIRKMMDVQGISEDVPVTECVVRREITTKGGKTYNKAPKIQRLITPRSISRKKHRIALKRSRAEKNKKEQAAYA